MIKNFVVAAALSVACFGANAQSVTIHTPHKDHLTKVATLNYLNYQHGKELVLGGVACGLASATLFAASTQPKHWDGEVNTLRTLGTLTGLASVGLIIGGNVKMERAINSNMKVVIKLTTIQ